MNYRPKFQERRVRITDKRARTVVGNMDKDPESLQEMTEGLSVPIIKLIKRAQREGLRGRLG